MTTLDGCASWLAFQRCWNLEKGLKSVFRPRARKAKVVLAMKGISLIELGEGLVKELVGFWFVVNPCLCGRQEHNAFQTLEVCLSVSVGSNISITARILAWRGWHDVLCACPRLIRPCSQPLRLQPQVGSFVLRDWSI